jgi:hypothetical protein
MPLHALNAVQPAICWRHVVLLLQSSAVLSCDAFCRTGSVVVVGYNYAVMLVHEQPA